MAVREVVPPELIADVKNYLQMDFCNDLRTDERIGAMIAAGMEYLARRLGYTPDFLADGEPRTLLMDFVRYNRDNAGDVFEQNYMSRIIAARNDRMVCNDDVDGTV